MAFGGRELRLVLSIQSYGTSNIQRLRRDIQQLQSQTEIANRRQAMLQDRLIRQQSRATRLQQSIARQGPGGAASITAAIRQSKLTGEAAKIAQQRATYQVAETSALTKAGVAQQNILRTQSKLRTLAEAGKRAPILKLEGRALEIAQERFDLTTKQAGLEARLHSANARALKAQEALSTAVTPRNQRMWREQFKAAQADQVKYRRAIAANEAALTGVTGRIRGLSPELQHQISLWSKQTAQVQALNLELNQNQAKLAQVNAELGKIQTEYAALDRRAGLLSLEEQRRLKILEEQGIALQTQKAQLAQIEAQIKATQADLIANQAAMTKAAKIDAATRGEAAARQVAHVGRMAQFAGLIAGAVLGLAAGSAASFSNQVSLAATQMRNLGEDAEGTARKTAILQEGFDKAGVHFKGILELMQEFPASADEMAQSAYDIYSSMAITKNGVVDVAAGLHLLEQANKLAVAGGVSLDEATQAMIVTLNNFDPTLSHVTRTLDTLMAVVRFGKLRLNDVSAAFSVLAPVATSAGISLADMGGAFAQLTILTGSASKSATGLGRAIELLRIPAFAEGLDNVWHAMGKTGSATLDANKRMLPLVQVIGNLRTIFPEVAKGQKAVIEALIQASKASGMTQAGIQGTVQARRALALLMTSYEQYRMVASNVANDNFELTKSFEARIKDPGVQWTIMVNRLRAFVIIVGREVLPVFLALGDKIGDLAKWFGNLDPAIRGTGLRLAAYAGVIALVGGTLLNVVGSLAAFQKNLILMGVISETTAGKFAALKMAVGTLALGGIFVLLSALFGVKHAIIDITVALIVWKSAQIAIAAISKATAASQIADASAISIAQQTAAVQTAIAWVKTGASIQTVQRASMIAGVVAAGEVAAANEAAAAATKAAWRAALVGTGVFAIAVAAGIAAELVMRNWDQVKAFFGALYVAIKTQWVDLMTHQLPGATLIGISEIIRHLNILYDVFLGLSKVPIPGFDKLFGGVAKAMDFLSPLRMGLIGMEKAGKELMASSGGEFSTAFNEEYDRLMAKYNQARKNGQKKTIDDLVKQFNKLTGKLYTQEYLDKVNKWYNDLAGGDQSETKRKSQARTNAMQQALDKQEQLIKTGVDNMINMYERFREEEERALGGFGQGPLMQGFMGNIFTQLNDMLRQFGVQIPIPFQILKKDMDQRLAYFKRFHADLAKLAKRGAPFQLIEEIRQMGPDQGIAIAEGLLQGSGKEFNGLVKSYNDTMGPNGVIDKATQEDLNRQLKYWKTFGNDAAYQMVMGIINNPRDAKLQKQFTNYIHKSFGVPLAAQLKKDFQDAYSQALEDIAASKVPTPKTPKYPGGMTGKDPLAQYAQAQRSAQAAMQNWKTLQTQRENAEAAAREWAKDPRSPGGVMTSPEEGWNIALLHVQGEQYKKKYRQAQARYRKATTRRSVAEEMYIQGRANPERNRFIITYEGDKYWVQADGATVGSVMKALGNAAWRRRHKVHRK